MAAKSTGFAFVILSIACLATGAPLDDAGKDNKGSETPATVAPITDLPDGHHVPTKDTKEPQCLEMVEVGQHDSCDSLVKRFGFHKGVFDLKAMNPGLRCPLLPIGAQLCVKSAILSTSNDEPSLSVNCSKSVPVSKGDTCYSLALQHDTRGFVDGLVSINPGVDCNNLVVDDPICVRVGPEFPCGRRIVAQKGDNCFDLAKEFNLAGLAEIEAINGWTLDDCLRLQEGQHICVKAP